MPAAGTVSRFRPPLGAGVRVDTHAYEGYRVPPFYDSLLAKVIVHGGDREQAHGDEHAVRWASSRSRAWRPPASCSWRSWTSRRFGSGRYTTAYLDDARAALPSLAEQVA